MGKSLLIINIIVLLLVGLIGQIVFSQSDTGDYQVPIGEDVYVPIDATQKSLIEPVKLSFENETVKQALLKLAQIGDFKLSYSQKFGVLDQSVHISLNNITLSEAISEVLHGTGLDYVVLESGHLALAPSERVADEAIIIEGRVVSSRTGDPLPGANVYLEGTGFGAATDNDGDYQIIIPDVSLIGEEFQLNVQYVGYRAISYTGILQAGAQTLDFEMDEDLLGMDEVVVIGYGEEFRANLVGAIGVIDHQKIAEVPVPRVSDALVGRIPGVIGLKSSGTPGQGTDLYIRGISTTGDSRPLIVIDGIPDRDIDDLHPDDVESISVLKDASAIAVYGARAANGVVLITTRQGSFHEEPRISVNFDSAVLAQTNYLDLLNSHDYARLYNQALQNDGDFNPEVGRGYTDEELQMFRDGTNPDRYPDTDWYREILSPTSLQTQLNVSVSGGSENTRYFVSGGYNNEGGFFPAVDFQRINLRSNLNTSISENLDFDLRLAGFFNDFEDVSPFNHNYIVGQAISTPAIEVNQFTDGRYNHVPSARGNTYLQSRGLNGLQNSTETTLNSNASLDWSIPFVDGLSVKGLLSYDITRGSFKSFRKPYEIYTMDADGNFSPVSTFPNNPDITERSNLSERLTWESSIRYNNSFGSHSFGGMLLYTQTKEEGRSFSTTRANFLSDQLEIINAGDPTQVSNSGFAFHSARQGLVGRFTYDYDKKYLLEFNFRYDGSYIFPPGNRFGFFPSIGLGWVLSEESFMERIAFINYLKLRGSWGQLGNDRVSPFQFMSTYSIAGAGYSLGSPNPTFYEGIRENVLPNPNITWERAEMSNIGIEALVFERLTFEANYYYKRTKDILAPRAEEVPDVIGIGLPDENQAIVDNYGFELSMGYEGDAGSLRYFLEPNVTFSRNKVVYYPESPGVPEWQRITGRPVGVGAIVGYIAEGLYQDQAEIDNGPTPLYDDVQPGDIRYKDVTGDGQITPDDMVIISKGAYPEIVYGFYMGGQYKNLGLNIHLQGAANVETYIHGNLAFPFSHDGHAQEFHKDYWTPDNPNASFPRLWANSQNNTQHSSYWLHDASFVRLKNVEVTYNLPSSIVNSFGAENIKVYFSGNNLLTFSSLDRLDPEQRGRSAAYPLIRTYNFGINLNF